MVESTDFWIFDRENPQFHRMMAEVEKEGRDPTIPTLAWVLGAEVDDRDL